MKNPENTKTESTDMVLTETDISKIQQIILDSGETVRKESIRTEGNSLIFRLLGYDADGEAAMKALWNNGLNGYSDGDLDTEENKTEYEEVNGRITSATVTMAIALGGLWK